MKQAIKSALKSVGLLDPIRDTKDRIHARLERAGLTPWKPLVPEESFFNVCKDSISHLRWAGHQFGDYLEFGVSRGTSMACMFSALQSAALTSARLVGFDSFRGMPPGSEREGWREGEFASTLSATRRYLRTRGVDLDRVELVPGWFSETCTAETAARLKLRKASIVMIDCDIYSASATALAFAGRFIDDRAIIMLDDWGWREEAGEQGQKEAFEEFLAAHPEFVAEPMPTYFQHSRVFEVRRAAAP
jgi:O-methyltransferase